MPLKTNSSIRQSASRMTVRALAGAALFLATSTGYAAAGPFDNFAGNWSGTGTIFVGDGGSERIRCRATYTVGASGAGLSQVLRCASDSYKFELTANVLNSNGALSGDWGEATRNVSGTLQGKMSGSDVQATVSTVGFNANLTLSLRGNKQTISIRSDNTDLRGVDIALAK